VTLITVMHSPSNSKGHIINAVITVTVTITVFSVSIVLKCAEYSYNNAL